MILDASLLSEEESHTLLKSVVVPRPIAWVSTLNSAGDANLAPYSCFTFVATLPPMICLSIGKRTGGGEKDTLANIRETQEFVVNMTSDSFAKAVTRTAAELPRGRSEWDVANVTPAACKKVRPSRIAESPVSLECCLAHTLELGRSRHTLVVGEVLAFHIQDHLFRDGRVDVIGFQPLARLSGDLFSKLGDVFEVKREG